MPVNAAVTQKYGIPGLKAAMDLVGLYGGPPRVPLRPVSGEVREIIRGILQSAGIATS